MINFYEISSKWYSNSGPLECYFKSTPFATLKYYLNEIQIESSSVISKNQINIENLNKDKIFETVNTIYLIDLPCEDSIDYALLLNNLYKIKPILSYNHIFNKYGIVGNKDLACKLISYSNLLMEHDKYNAYAFIMDYNRYIEDIDLNNPMIYNNQYEITEEELPYVEVLKDLNIKSVTFITKEIIKEDINKYIDYLNDNDIKVDIIKIK